MPFSHTITRAYRDSSGTSITATETVTSNEERSYDDSVADGQTAFQVDISLVRSTLKALSIYSDRAVTIKTNSSSSPTDTITLVAGQNLVWSLATDGLSKCPISASVTALYIANASGAAASVKIRSLSDATP